MINNVVLVGRMTMMLNFAIPSQNQAVATFTLAVNRNFKNHNGEREYQCCHLASAGRKSLQLGQACSSRNSGRIQTRNYENQQGSQRVYVTEVAVVITSKLLEKPRKFA